jgi:ABC-type transport system involved in cytochrome bd biosynthesis fused ATPase/permease subunit
LDFFSFLVVRQFLEDSTAAHTLTPHIGLFLILVARQFLEDSTLLFEETLAKRDKNKLMKEALETLINLRMKRVDRTLAEVSAQLTNLSKDVKDAKKWTPSHSKA